LKAISFRIAPSSPAACMQNTCVLNERLRLSDPLNSQRQNDTDDVFVMSFTWDQSCVTFTCEQVITTDNRSKQIFHKKKGCCRFFFLDQLGLLL
jgi:hypothetical protein